MSPTKIIELSEKVNEVDILWDEIGQLAPSTQTNVIIAIFKKRNYTKSMAELFFVVSNRGISCEVVKKVCDQLPD